jgi:carbonic anhydrase
MQSPIDLRPSGAVCDEHHEVRSRRGDFQIFEDEVTKEIQPNKLRLRYKRRPCRNLNELACQEPDPPNADFPNNWGGYADVTHIDFKVPGEHLIRGEKFDGEMQIFHIHRGRRRMVVQSVTIRATSTGFNSYFQEAIDVFRAVYDINIARCSALRRKERRLVSNAHIILGKNMTSKFHDYSSWGDFSTGLEDVELESKRSLRKSNWDPYHELLIPSIHFYRYDGSLTEPPCGEFVSWFVSDTPMRISLSQLEEVKTILFKNVDENCQPTSVQFGHSVARPIQETAGRPVWQCTPREFGPDP